MYVRVSETVVVGMKHDHPFYEESGFLQMEYVIVSDHQRQQEYDHARHSIQHKFSRYSEDLCYILDTQPTTATPVKTHRVIQHNIQTNHVQCSKALSVNPKF
jgi:hypothetical protein